MSKDTAVTGQSVDVSPIMKMYDAELELHQSKKHNLQMFFSANTV